GCGPCRAGGDLWRSHRRQPIRPEARRRGRWLSPGSSRPALPEKLPGRPACLSKPARNRSLLCSYPKPFQHMKYKRRKLSGYRVRSKSDPPKRPQDRLHRVRGFSVDWLLHEPPTVFPQFEQRAAVGSDCCPQCARVGVGGAKKLTVGWVSST